MIYRDPEPYSKQEIEDAVKSKDDNQIVDMMLGVAFNEPDYDVAFKVISQFANSKSDRLRDITVLCIGHLAGFHKHVYVYQVAEIINNALADESKDVRIRVQDALSDIRGCCPRQYAEMKHLLVNVNPQ